MSPDQRAATLRSLWICFLYAITSMIISLAYKALLSSYAFDAKLTLLACQLMLALAFCAFAKVINASASWGWYITSVSLRMQRNLQHIPGLEVPTFDRIVFRRWCTAIAGSESIYTWRYFQIAAAGCAVCHQHRAGLVWTAGERTLGLSRTLNRFYQAKHGCSLCRCRCF